MADFELRAGAHLTLLTSKEFASEMDRVTLAVADVLRQEAGETVIDQGLPFKTNSAGNGSGAVFRVPAGYDCYATRVVVDWPTASAKTGGTACTVRICADTVTAATTRAINNTIPSVYEASRSHAPLFRGGQLIVVGVSGGPHTQTLFCSVQVILAKRRPLVTDTLEPEGM